MTVHRLRCLRIAWCAAIVAPAGALGLSSGALASYGFKIAEERSLDYSSAHAGEVYLALDGQTALKTAFWIDLNNGPNCQVVFSMAAVAAPRGISCFYRRDLQCTSGAEVRQFVLGVGNGQDSAEVATNVGTAHADSGWVHVAFDVEMTANVTRLRAWFNGELQSDVTDFAVLFADGLPLDPADVFFLGRDDLGSFLNGHLHDVFIGAGLWTPTEIANFGDSGWTPAGTSEPFWSRPASTWVENWELVRLFYAPLRETTSAEVFTMFGEHVFVKPLLSTVPPVRGIGPPLDYTGIDARERVLVIGDTQTLARNQLAHIYVHLGRFIREQHASLQVRAVMHVGDFVWRTEIPSQVENAGAFANEFIKEGVPFTLTMGNHDQDDRQNPTRTYLNISGATGASTLGLPMSLVDTQPWFDEAMAVNGSGATPDEDYVYSYEFELFGETQLGVVLPFHPTEAMLEWVAAKAGEPAYGTARLWVTVHKYIQVGGAFSGVFDVPLPPNGIIPQTMWDQHLSQIGILRVVACGHHHQGESGPPTFGAFRKCDGVPRPVHNLIVNDQEGTQGGRGFMAILTISPDGTVEMEGYRSWTNEFTGHFMTFNLDDPNQCGE